MANPRGAISLSNDQARGAQHAEVLRDRRSAPTKIARDQPDGVSTAAQQAQDLPASWVGNRPKQRIPFSPLDRHHYVALIVTEWLRLCQRLPVGLDCRKTSVTIIERRKRP